MTRNDTVFLACSELHKESSFSVLKPWLSGVATPQLNVEIAVVVKLRIDPFVVPPAFEAAARK
jgi:hypothetical protein